MVISASGRNVQVLNQQIYQVHAHVCSCLRIASINISSKSVICTVNSTVLGQ